MFRRPLFRLLGILGALVLFSSNLHALTIDTTNRTEVNAAYGNFINAHPSDVAATGWSGGNIATCSIGTTSTAYQQATIDAANFYRALAGLPSTTLITDTTTLAGSPVGATIVNRARLAALFSVANFPTLVLEHKPAGGTCYSTEVYAGTSTSNLAMGYGAPSAWMGGTGPGAIDGYIVEDYSTDASATTDPVLGHRRWILYTEQVGFATGEFINATVPNYLSASSLRVWSADASEPDSLFVDSYAPKAWVAWPSPNFVPYTLIPATQQPVTPVGFWSLSYPNARFNAATVTMTKTIGATTTSVPITKTVELASGYGDNTLMFEPNLTSFAAGMADTSYKIVVSGITGAPSSTYCYTVTVFDPAQTIVSTAPDLCNPTAQRPNITAQSADASYTQGAAASPLTVTAGVTDGGALSYQWYSNTTSDTSGGTPVSTATSYTPSTANVGTFYYYVVVTNTHGGVTNTATSSIFTVVVSAPATGTNIIYLDDANPPLTGVGWTYSGGANGLYTVLDGADVIVENSNAGSWREIAVATNATATITLNGMSLSIGSSLQSGLTLYEGANVTLVLADGTDNTFTGYTGIDTTGATLTINGGATGTGSLTATGTDDVGIGGSYGSNITINGGTITAIGSDMGAGIGGTGLTNGGNITINGGMVFATGGSNGGAGIGGAGTLVFAGMYNPSAGSGGNITITGGIVNATSCSGASTCVGAAIGGGGAISGDPSTISNGVGGDGGNIVISGGSITANPNNGYGAAIGGGGVLNPNPGSDPVSNRGGFSGNILIYGENTTVTALGVSGYEISAGYGPYGVIFGPGSIFVAIPKGHLQNSLGDSGNSVLFTADPATTTGNVTATLPAPFNAAPFGSGTYTLMTGLDTTGKTFSVMATFAAPVNIPFALSGYNVNPDPATDSFLTTTGAQVKFTQGTALTFTYDASFDVPPSTVGTPITPIDVSGGVSGGTAPYTFTAAAFPNGLSISSAGIISGTPTTPVNCVPASACQATLYVVDSAHASQSITIHYGTISAAAPTYGIMLDQSGTYTFPPATIVYPAQPALTVTITNTGTAATGSLTITKTGDTSAFTTPSSIAGVAAGSTNTFTVTPASGLAAGTYNATITVSNTTNGISASFDVTFTVNPAIYSISLDQTGTVDLGSVTIPYTTQPAFTVTITNNGTAPTGNLSVAMTGSTTAFTRSPSTVTSIAAGSIGTFTVTPANSLAAGTYTATITVTGGNGISASFDVTFTTANRVGTNIIDLSDANPPPTGVGWTYGTTTSIYTILDQADVIVINDNVNAGTTTTNSHRLEVAPDATATITLNNMSISLGATFSALLLDAGANVTLILPDGTDNTLKGGTGIQTTDATLTINSETAGTGTLNLTGYAGAGIGGKEAISSGGNGYDGGDLTINGGIINITPSSVNTFGACIGGGNGGGSGYSGGSGGNITINDGTITLSGCNGALIGGGTNSGTGGIGGNGGNITINGGTIIATATSAYTSAIGGGSGGSGAGSRGGDGGNITINDGNITASSYSLAAGIGGGGTYGGGNGGNGGNIVITGGEVNATGGMYGAGIGGASGGNGGNIIISGGTVTATGGAASYYGGAGIGGGSSNSTASTGGASGNILIYGENTVVTANKGTASRAQDIGAGYNASGTGLGATDAIFVALPEGNLNNASGEIGNPVLFTADQPSADVVTVTLPTPFDAAPFGSGTYDLMIGLDSTGKTFSVLTSFDATNDTPFALTGYDVSPDPATGADLTAIGANIVFTLKTYGIALSETGTHDFGSLYLGYPALTPLSVTVNNTGNQPTGDLSVALSGANAGSFTLSKTTITSIARSGFDTFTVVPNTGLAVGTYNATVTVSGNNSISESFDVTFTVLQPIYTISLTPSSAHDFGSVAFGYSAQTPWSVTVNNTGNQPTGNLTVGSSTGNFTLSKTSITSIAVSGSDTFTVVPNTGLAAGTYSATVTVSGGNGITASFDVSFTVTATAQTPTLSNLPSGTTTYTQGDAASPLTITATITDGGTLSFQWYRNTTASTSGGTPVCGNSASCTPDTGTAGTFYYYVVVTNTSVVNGTTSTATSTIATIVVNQPPGTNTIDLSLTNPPLTGVGWSYSGGTNGVYTIHDAADVIVINSNSGSQRRLEVDADAKATVTLNGMTIAGLTSQQTALLLNAGADVHLVLAASSSNYLTSGLGSAGIQTTDATLTISDAPDGILTVTGGDNSAGIGGWFNNGNGSDGGTIIINSGEVHAFAGTDYAAGIGGAYGGDGGNITINGGTVNATGSNTGWGGAGIGGGGYGAAGGNIVITGGTVTAAGGIQGAAGIGGGYNGPGGNIFISGGTIIANAGNGGNGAGIGGGQGTGGASGNILIYGENTVVTANGNDGAQDIGAGYDTYGAPVPTDNVFVAIPKGNLKNASGNIGNDVLFTATPLSAGIVTMALPSPFDAAPFGNGTYNVMTGLNPTGKTFSVMASFSATDDIAFALPGYTLSPGSATTGADLVTAGAFVEFSAPVGSPLTFTYNPAFDIPASTVNTPITPIDVSGNAAGGTTPYSFSATGLPSGITISAAGVISGTPTTATTCVPATACTATITVTDSASPSDSQSITINYGAISPAPTYGITLSQTGTYTFPSATSGYAAQTALGVTVTNTGNQPTGALTVALSGTDAGSFTLSPTTPVASIAVGSTGSFTVVPNTGLAAGTYNATVTVSNANVTAKSFNVSFTVTAAPDYHISLSETGTHTFPSATVGYGAQTALNVTVNNTGNQPTGALTVTSSTTAFTVSPTTPVASIAVGGTGSFTVVPNTGLGVGTYSATVTVSNTGNGITASFDVSFTVSAAPDYTITLTPSGTHDFGSVTSGYGAQTALNVTVNNTGNQPTGALTVTSSTTAFTVSPTTVASIAVGGTGSFTVVPNTGLGVGTYNAQITVSNTNTTANFNVSFTVTAAPIGPTITTSPGALTAGMVNTPYSVTLTSSDPSATWARVSGSLPTGLTLSAAGVISGTPTAAGTFYFSVTATDTGGTSAPVAFSILISPMGSSAPTITTTPGGLPEGYLGTSYSGVTLTSSDPVTWSVTSGTFPPGLTLDPATGAIYGTPTATGTFNFTVTASNGGGSASASFIILVSPPGGPGAQSIPTLNPAMLVLLALVLAVATLRQSQRKKQRRA